MVTTLNYIPAERTFHNHFKEKTGYIVRIELYEIEHRQRYQQLHYYLRDAGFSNVIVSGRGVDSKLLAAIYYSNNPGSRYGR